MKSAIVGTNVVVIPYGYEITNNWHATPICLARRNGGHGHGMWGLPGGKHDPGETVLHTLHREPKEEIGVDVDLVHGPLILNMIHANADGQQFIDVAALMRIKYDGLIGDMEPHKIIAGPCTHLCMCTQVDSLYVATSASRGWHWFTIGTVLQMTDLFYPTLRVIHDLFESPVHKANDVRLRMDAKSVSG